MAHGSSLPESDWRVLRTLHRIALDRYCARVLDECAAVLRSTGGSPHDRYMQLFRLVRDRDDELADAFNDLRRSSAIRRLAAMIILNAVTEDELAQFSPATREAALGCADIWRP